MSWYKSQLVDLHHLNPNERTELPRPHVRDKEHAIQIAKSSYDDPNSVNYLNFEWYLEELCYRMGYGDL